MLARNGRMPLILMLLICFLGFGLRVYQLEGQSLWNDEGLSVYRAKQDVSVILANTITIDGVDTTDTNPPLYFLLLHFWYGLGGDSVFTLRLLGALFGVLNVPLIFRLGRYLHGTAVGLLAAFLLAISPFHIWQSQEMRNYSLLLLFNLISVYALFRFVFEGQNKWKWLGVWVITAAAGVYTHYFGAFVLAFGLLVVAWVVVRGRDWRRFMRPRFIGLAGLLFVLALPIFWMGYSRFQAGRQIDFAFVPLHHLLSHAGSAYGAGIIQRFVQPLWRSLPAVLLAGLGLFVPGWRGRRLTPVLLMGYLLTPILLLLLLSAINPIYNGPRHLLMGLPPFLLLAAGGIASLRGRWRIVTAVLALWMVFVQVDWLEAQFHSPELVKDDIRGLAEYLGQVAQPGDVIVLHDSISGVTFDYYYEGLATWTAVPALSQANVEAAIEQMREIGQGARRVFFVTEPTPRTGFPRNALKEWANDNWPKLYDRRFGSLWLALNLEVFETEPEAAVLPEAVEGENVNWSDELTLVGAASPAIVQAGGYWQPVFYWSQQEAHPGGYDMSLRLTDESGNIWLQIDQPLWGRFPPAAWPTGEIIQYASVYELPAGLPPGSYQVRMRLSRTADGQPLMVNGEENEWVVMQSLMVKAAKASDGLDWLPENTADGIRFGGQIELAGYQVPGVEYRPGHIVTVELFWQVLKEPPADYQLHLQLVDNDGTVLTEASGPPTRADYPASSWQVGDLLHGQGELIIPATAAAGRYRVRVGLLDPVADDYLSAGGLFGRSLVDLAAVEVVAWDLVTDLPPVATALTAEFGEPALVRLHGYDLSAETAAPGDMVTLSLIWESLTGEIPANYTVFVHLADTSENIVAQGDSVPVNGFRPTSGWRMDEVIVDEHRFRIPEGTPPGRYRLWVGFYEPGTNLRLTPLVDGVVQPDGRLLLTEITVEP